MPPLQLGLYHVVFSLSAVTIYLKNLANLNINMTKHRFYIKDSIILMDKVNNGVFLILSE